MTLGSHQQTIGKSQDWITPKWIIDALGPFDLDPCASESQPWPCASQSLTCYGLEAEWYGRVWLNPPFDRRVIGLWIEKLAAHGDGMALVHVRPETAWFRPIWAHATAIAFLRHRITFSRPDGTEGQGNSGAPVCVAAFGNVCRLQLARSDLSGVYTSSWAVR